MREKDREKDKFHFQSSEEEEEDEKKVSERSERKAGFLFFVFIKTCIRMSIREQRAVGTIGKYI